ncbi:MAG: sulfotransferase domain-containing protein [Rhizomicrobium sp.]|nr:sulfotransferase domain-containing protein [Rhizomicrobium sp.]
MAKTFWLASYPKSGNTWLRIMLARLDVPGGEPMGVNALVERGINASVSSLIEEWLFIDPSLLTHDEADYFRSLACIAIADRDRMEGTGSPPDDSQTTFVKVHDAYLMTNRATPLLGGALGADGAIVIVRDPRDLVLSLASHFGRSINYALDFLNDTDAAFASKCDRRDRNLRQRLSDWSGHVESWLDQSDIPVHLVRYENMLRDPAASLSAILTFVGREVSVEAIHNAVRDANFSDLQRQEEKNGFRESPGLYTGQRFFRAGTAGQWRNTLTREVVARIEAQHGAVMSRLGYARAAEDR